MCFTSGTRGEMNKPPSFSLYRSLYILTKCLISPLTVGAIRTLILYFRVVVLELLGAEKSEILHAATLATEAAQTHDTSHCPFWSLCFHIIAQTHMAYPSPGGPAESEDLLVKDLEVVEKVSHKWEFGLPMLNNLHARILQKYAHMKPSHPVLRTLVESQRAHAQQAQTQNNDAVDDGLMANMSDADRERASTIFTNAIAAAGMDKPKPSIIDTMNSLNDKFSTTMQMNEAELISMTNLRKGLTTGTHAPGIDSIHDSLSPDGVFPNIGIPALAPIAPLISAMRMQSGASPHGAGQAPFEKSYTPPVTQFQRPGLDELMQFEIGDDGPLPNELLQPQPMHSPSLLSPGPGYDASQGMYPPTKDASLGSLGLGGSLFQQGGYRGPSPGAAYGHTIVSPRELQQKEQELRQQLNALIAQQQQQNHQQMYQPPRNDYISSPPAYHPAQAQAHYPQQQQQPGLSPQQILALNSLLSSPTGEGIQQSRYQPSVTPSQYGTQYYSPQVPQVPAQYAGGYDNSYDRIDPAALHGVPAVKPLPSGPYTAYSHLQRTQQ
jgi:hypothetical protein